METKTIIIGEQQNTFLKKKIVFRKYLDMNFELVKPGALPNSYNYIELICSNYNSTTFDLMYAYNKDDRSRGCFYIGNWNDGVV